LFASFCRDIARFWPRRSARATGVSPVLEWQASHHFSLAGRQWRPAMAYAAEQVGKVTEPVRDAAWNWLLGADGTHVPNGDIEGKTQNGDLMREFALGDPFNDLPAARQLGGDLLKDSAETGVTAAIGGAVPFG